MAQWRSMTALASASIMHIILRLIDDLFWWVNYFIYSYTNSPDHWILFDEYKRSIPKLYSLKTLLIAQLLDMLARSTLLVLVGSAKIQGNFPFLLFLSQLILEQKVWFKSCCLTSFTFWDQKISVQHYHLTVKLRW